VHTHLIFRNDAQLRPAFQELENENREKYNPSTLVQNIASKYQNHYNTKLDRCLLLIRRVLVLPLATNLSDQQRQMILIDANEKRPYATFVETQLATEMRPRIDKCELAPDIRLKMACSARNDFDAFVARYLEQ
jgi:hypothetical protein